MSPPNMHAGLFVTGTDTGVGKTLVASALLHQLAQRGLRAAGMKPVASGATYDGRQWRNDDVDALRAAASVALPAQLMNPYLLQQATAPHLAARAEGVTIDLAHLVRCYQQIAQTADVVVVEGAGGFMVPLNDSSNSDDLVARLGLPVILTVGIRLGCINHALLTQLAIQTRRLHLIGWVANQIDADEVHAQAMMDSLAQRLNAPLLGCLPWMPGIDAVSAGPLLDLTPLGWPAPN